MLCKVVYTRASAMQRYPTSIRCAYKQPTAGAAATDHKHCFDAERCIVRAHRPDHERVVITGMGVASCFGNDVDTFYDS